VLQSRCLGCCLRDVDALSAFDLDSLFRSMRSKRFEEVCNGINCMRSLIIVSWSAVVLCRAHGSRNEVDIHAYLECCNERLFVIYIGLNNLDASGSQGGGFLACRISSETPDSICAAFQSSIDHRQALVACGSNNGKEFVHVQFLWMFEIIGGTSRGLE
jgi:hypothetical protein